MSKIFVYTSITLLSLISALSLSNTAYAATGCCTVMTMHVATDNTITVYINEEKDKCISRNNSIAHVTALYQDGAVAADKKSCGAKGAVDFFTSKISAPIANPKLSVSIPGFLGFQPPKCDAESCTSNWIAQYIAALYHYGIGSIAILAVIVLMIAGIMWLTSAGNSSKVEEAKKLMQGSIFGMILAFSSYMILTIVNPALTKFSPIKLAYVGELDTEEITQEEQISAQNISGPITTTSSGNTTITSFGKGTNGVPLIMQCKEPVSSITYGKPENKCSSTICSSGCGAASIAMVIFYFQKDTNFQNVLNTIYTNKGRESCGNGTANESIQKVAKDYGLATQRDMSGYDWAAEKAKTCPVVISVHNIPACGKDKECQKTKKCPFTGNQHYIVITGNNNGILSINDPIHGGTTISLSDLKAKCVYGTGATQICKK